MTHHRSCNTLTNYWDYKNHPQRVQSTGKTQTQSSLRIKTARPAERQGAHPHSSVNHWVGSLAHLSGPKAPMEKEDLRLQDKYLLLLCRINGEAVWWVNRATNDSADQLSDVGFQNKVAAALPPPFFWFCPSLLRPEIKGMCLELEGTAKQTLGRAECWQCSAFITLM